MLAAGWPVMLNGAVNAADKPMRFTSRPATGAARASPRPANAVVGVVGVRSRSTCRPDACRRDQQLVAPADRLVQAARSQVHHHSTPARCTVVSSSRCWLSKLEVEGGRVERRQQSPRDAGLGQLDGDVDELETRFGDQRHAPRRARASRLRDRCPRSRASTSTRRASSEALGRLAGRDEILERDRRRRQRRRVGGRRAGRRRRGSGRRRAPTHHRAVHRRQRVVERLGPRAEEPERRLHAEQARVRRRDADRAAAVAAGARGEHAGRDRRRRPARRAAGCALEVPRVASDAVQRRGR